MEKLFYPQSIVIIGLSAKTNNIPKLVLENLLRWGYRGRIFGVNPKNDEVNVSGFAVICADLCEKAGFEFAHPGEEFYKTLNKFANAGVIKFSNPLDMGDIYDPHMAAHVIYEALHNENVDGAIYIGQKPSMPAWL